MAKIKASNFYMCLKDISGYDSFTKGKIYSSIYDNALINDNHIEVKVMNSEYFRIASDKEIFKAKLDRLKEETTIGLSEWENGVEHGRMEIINALYKTLDSMQEEPKKCMYTKDNYTEDRKVLCDGCEEKCEYTQKEADWLQELQDKLDSLSKEDFEKVWAKYHQKEEPVSEDFETALEKKVREAQNWTYIEEEGGEYPLNEEFGAYDLEEFARWGAEWARNNKKEPVSEVLLDTTQTITYKGEVYIRYYKDKLDAFACKYPMSVPKSSKRYAKYSDVDLTIAVKEGANWHKQQMMANAVDVTVHIDNGNYPYIPQMELYDYDKDIPLAKEGDKYKVVLIKEE